MSEISTLAFNKNHNNRNWLYIGDTITLNRTGISTAYARFGEQGIVYSLYSAIVIWDPHRQHQSSNPSQHAWSSSVHHSHSASTSNEHLSFRDAFPHLLDPTDLETFHNGPEPMDFDGDDAAYGAYDTLSASSHVVDCFGVHDLSDTNPLKQYVSHLCHDSKLTDRVDAHCILFFTQNDQKIHYAIFVVPDTQETSSTTDSDAQASFTKLLHVTINSRDGCSCECREFKTQSGYCSSISNNTAAPNTAPPQSHPAVLRSCFLFILVYTSKPLFYFGNHVLN